MPTAPNTSAKADAKAPRKPAAAKATSATKAKSARTRAAHQTEAAAKQTQTASKETASAIGDYAERALLIPVGAALIARERIASSVSDTVSTYSSSAKTQAQLRRFERRGETARKRVEREVRKARVRVERELRQRRKEIETTVNDTFNGLDARRERITKNVPDFVDQVQERLLNLV